MAENNTYTLIIKSEVSESKESNFSGVESVGESAATPADDFGAQLKTLKAFAVSRIVSPIVTSAISYAKSHVNMYTGSQHLQDQVDYAFQVVGNIGTVASGAVAGSLLGPIGTAIGALGGLIAVGIGYGQRRMEYNYNRSWDDVNIGVQQGRAGPSFNRSRIGS